MALDWADISDEVAPTMLILVGFVLFVFPEPATSALGVGLLLLGSGWWVYEWGREWVA
jgi:hypothetical protein